MSATDGESREFARAFTRFLEWVHQGAVDGGAREVVDLVQSHVGAEDARRSVVSREHELLEHVNLQVAFDAWSGEPGRTVTVHGIGMPPNYGRVSLGQLLRGVGLPPLEPGAPELVDLPSGPHETKACFNLALLLVEDEHGRYAMLVSGPQPHDEPSLVVEIAGLDVTPAQHVHDTLTRLMVRLNVHRGHVLELVSDRRGGIRLHFVEPPRTARGEVVLPEESLRRVERHTLGVASHRDALLAAGQHLKRGLLLFGPPGTGKTHTIRYLIGRLAGHTVLQLSGRSLHAVGAVARMARDLQPAVVVLEDVDLVAHERDWDGSTTVLFELLDAMDGAAPDADLLFLLTTNRADVLEPALAARPGRVDVAVEIARPDADGRRRLLALYGAQAPLALTDDEVDEVVERTEGTTASFFKELVRRAVVESLERGTSEPVTGAGEVTRQVTAVHVRHALDDLLDSTQAVTRALLGAGEPSEDADEEGAPDWHADEV